MGAAAGKIQSEKARHAEELVNAVESIEKRHPGTFGGTFDFNSAGNGAGADARGSIEGGNGNRLLSLSLSGSSMSPRAIKDSSLLFTKRVQSIADSEIDTPEKGAVYR